MEMMKNFKSFLCALLVNYIVTVLSASEHGIELIEDKSKCYRLVPLFRINCASQCPETIPEGRCLLQSENKWDCFCGETNGFKKLYNADVAKNMYKVCNGQKQNNGGCTKLCPKGFYEGYCDDRHGIWQCVCNQKNSLYNFYTLNEAMLIKTVCNVKIHGDNAACTDMCPTGFIGECQSKTCYCTEPQETGSVSYSIPSARVVSSQSRFCTRKIQNDEQCKQLCPPNFRIGRCEERDGMWKCLCGQNREHELYDIREANDIYQACYGPQSENACSRLCPHNLRYGECFTVVPISEALICGCKGNFDQPYPYTLKKAHEMSSVCNQETFENKDSGERCNELCPQGFIEAKCDRKKLYYECFCKHADQTNWFTLERAIFSKRLQTNGKRKSWAIRMH